jgi:hypothetical protein
MTDGMARRRFLTHMSLGFGLAALGGSFARQAAQGYSSGHDEKYGPIGLPTPTPQPPG